MEKEFKYVVVLRKDFKYLSDSDIIALASMIRKVEDARRAEGKRVHDYIVVSTDEPYANQIWDIVRENE